MVDTVDLTYEDEHWLKFFSKNNKFFRSLNYNYKRYGRLTENQYHYLEKEIDKAENKGYAVLSKKETRIFRELAEKEADARKLLKKYSVDGYFVKSNYELFRQLKDKYLPENQKIEYSHRKGNDKLESLSPLEYKIVKIPCPYCSFLCPIQIKFCKKCGEPLPKM